MADMTALEWRISELEKRYPSWIHGSYENEGDLFLHHDDIMNTFEGQRAKLLCYSYCSTIGGVYFITDGKRAFTKIGMSRNIAKRFIQHMETAKMPLYLQGFIPCGAAQMRVIERMCHLIFKDLNTRKDNTLNEMFFNEEGENGYPNPANAAKCIEAVFDSNKIHYIDCDSCFWNNDYMPMRPIYNAQQDEIKNFEKLYGPLSENMVYSLSLESMESDGWGE